MNIIVFIKPVPDPEYYHKITIDSITKRLNRNGIPTVMNPSDRNALECAVCLKENNNSGKVIVISMTPLPSRPILMKCLALGADEAYLVSDIAFGGADTFSTSYTLSRALEKLNIKSDLILCGNESSDGATSHVPSQLGEWLGLPHISNVSSIQIDDGKAFVLKKMENGSISYKVKLPALFAVSRESNVPRMTSAYGIVQVKNKKLEILTKEDLDVNEDLIGLAGSPTQPGDITVLEKKRTATELLGDEKQIAQEIYKIIKQSGISIKGGAAK